MKIISWNVNGIRSRIFNDMTSTQIKNYKIIKHDACSPMQEILDLKPDIICLQETRCDEINGDKFKIDNFKSFFNPSKEKDHRGPNRYSGTAVFISESIEIENIEIQIPGYNDTEGRIIIIHTIDTVVISVYAPNSGSNYDKKIIFIDAMLNYLNNINKKVIFCGDLNIAHDVHFDKSKVNPSPGIYEHELKFYYDLLDIGFKDCIENDPIVYTWWDQRAKKENGIPCTRVANKGWRLDYFFAKRFNKVSNKVYKNIGERNPLSSDHAPIFLITE